MLKRFFVTLILCLSVTAVQAIPTGNGNEFIPAPINLGIGFFNPAQKLAVNGAALFAEKGANPLPSISSSGGLIYVNGSHLFFKSQLRTGSGFQLDFDSSDNTTFNNPTFTGNVTFNPFATVSGFNSVGTLNGNNLLAQNIINGATLVGDVVKVNNSLTAPLITAPTIASNVVLFNQNGGNLWGNNFLDSYRKYYKQYFVSGASSTVLTDSDGNPLSRLKSYKLTAWTNGTATPTGAVAYFAGDGLSAGPLAFTLRKEYQEDIKDYDVKFFINGTTGAPTIALFNDNPANLNTVKLVKILVEETPHFGSANYSFGANQALSVNKLGNVGVGVEAPNEKLEVAGNVKATRFIGSSISVPATSPGFSGNGAGLTNIDNGGVGGLTANGLVFASRTGKLTNNPSKIFIDPVTSNIGIGTTIPVSKLDVEGAITLGDSVAVCNASIEGSQRYNSTGKRMEFCNGTSWSAFGASGIVPSFLVHRNGIDQALSSGTLTDVDWTHETFDNTNAFDLTTNRFTPQVAGKYLIVWNMSIIDNPSNSKDDANCTLYKNTTLISLAFAIDESSDPPHITASCSTIVELNGSSDYVKASVQFVDTPGSTTRYLEGTAGFSYMTGVKVSD